MSVTVTFGCGHKCELDPEKDKRICPECGDKRVSAVKAPKPTFKGVR